MRRLLLLSFFLLFTSFVGVVCWFPTIARATCEGDSSIPTAACNDPRYSLGYLVCDEYTGVLSNGTGDSTNGINACIVDAYDHQLTAYLEDCNGTYMISNTLVLYEWQSNASAPLNNHVFRGAVKPSCGTNRATLKITTGSTNFNSATTLRPMVVYRQFWPTTTPAAAQTAPSHPLACGGDGVSSICGGAAPNPTGYRESAGTGFQNVFDNINLDTSGKVGAIGITMQTGQACFIMNSKMTLTNGSTHSFAGIYQPPGRNSPVINVEVIGGQYGILSVNVAGTNLALPSNQGLNFFGLILTLQQVRALYLSDGAGLTVAGFEITKSADGPAIEMQSAGSLIDGKITLSGLALNDIAIENRNSGGRGLSHYTRNVFISGTSQLIRSGSTITLKTGGALWARIAEYSHIDTYQDDTSNLATTFPLYDGVQSNFEARSVINGTLAGGSGGVALADIVHSSTAPPADIRTRHVWSGTLPSFEEVAFTDPRNYRGCTAQLGYDMRQAVNKTPDCADAINDAITAAANAGHNRVVLPRGALIITKTLNLGEHTKLFGAGPRKSNIAYMDDWLPTSAVPFLQTVDSDSATTYAGFFSMYIRTQPVANDFMYYARWRAGKNSMTVGIHPDYQFMCKCSSTCLTQNQPRKAWWFSGHGGGRHYGANLDTGQSLERDANARYVYVDDTDQPLAWYGLNLEMGKGLNSCTITQANAEVLNSDAGVRFYGIKREGRSATVWVTSSSNVGIFSVSGLSNPTEATSIGQMRVSGASSNVVIAPNNVRDNPGAANTQKMLSESISPTPSGGNAGTIIPWPNSLGFYKRGTLNDTPFQASGTPPVEAPQFLSAIVSVASHIDLCWQTFDSAALTPSSDTTGWTVTVNGVPKLVQSSSRVGLNCYDLVFAGGTITTNTQTVQIKYDPGNIKAGGVGTPDATAFAFTTATNNLSPTSVALLDQVGFFFRSIHGDMELANSPPYRDEGSDYENIPARFIPGALFRLPIQMTNTVAAAATQAFTVCYSENGGAYTLLPEDCTAANTCFTDAPDLADSLPVEQHLTPTGLTYVAGGVLEHAATQVLVTLPANSETIYEPAIQIASAAAVNTTYDYRLCTTGGAVLSAYTRTPRVTIVNPRGSQAGGGRYQ